VQDMRMPCGKANQEKGGEEGQKEVGRTRVEEMQGAQTVEEVQDPSAINAPELLEPGTFLND